MGRRFPNCGGWRPLVMEASSLASLPAPPGEQPHILWHDFCRQHYFFKSQKFTSLYPNILNFTNSDIFTCFKTKRSHFTLNIKGSRFTDRLSTEGGRAAKYFFWEGKKCLLPMKSSTTFGVFLLHVHSTEEELSTTPPPPLQIISWKQHTHLNFKRLFFRVGQFFHCAGLKKWSSKLSQK